MGGPLRPAAGAGQGVARDRSPESRVRPPGPPRGLGRERRDRHASGQLVARIAPIALKASEQVRLGRLWPHAVYKEDQGQLVGPLPKGVDPALALVDLLRALVPPPATAGRCPGRPPRGTNICRAVKRPLSAPRRLPASWRAKAKPIAPW